MRRRRSDSARGVRLYIQQDAISRAAERYTHTPKAEGRTVMHCKYGPRLRWQAHRQFKEERAAGMCHATNAAVLRMGLAYARCIHMHGYCIALVTVQADVDTRSSSGLGDHEAGGINDNSQLVGSKALTLSLPTQKPLPRQHLLLIVHTHLSLVPLRILRQGLQLSPIQFAKIPLSML